MTVLNMDPGTETGLTPALVDAKACAAYLSVSLSTWHRLVANGKAPRPVKVGRLTRWRIADLEAYVSSL